VTDTRYVALLRGINLGPRNRIAMADLRAVVASAGLDDVATHIQTGNVLVTSAPNRADAVEGAIKGAIRTELGLEIEVIVRTAAQLRRIVKGNPFLAKGAEPPTLYVGFLKARPAAPNARRLEGTDFGDDELALKGTEVYLRFAHGFGRSKLGGPTLERTLEVPLTVRNWKVVNALADLATQR
jgi:uncharacterized protein (DUF1697 family)